MQLLHLPLSEFKSDSTESEAFGSGLNDVSSWCKLLTATYRLSVSLIVRLADDCEAILGTESNADMILVCCFMVFLEAC